MPPELVDDNIYSYTTNHPILYVHKAALEAFKSHVYWGRVPRIIPIESVGDINNDDSIDIDDVTKIIEGLLEGDASLDEADAEVNFDGSIDIDDITTLISIVLNGN